MNYEYTPLFYNEPTQVKFYDGLEFVGGIAYQNYIICGCCGGIFQIEDVIEMAKANDIHFDDAIVELEWVSIEEEIRGD